jgi:hypothetical protein
MEAQAKGGQVIYKSGYKFKLIGPTYVCTAISPAKGLAVNKWIYLTEEGKMTISDGYAWDGASGAIDTKSIMRASLVHDALYQMIREGLPIVRKEADKEFYRIMRKDGMWWIRAQYIYWAVRLFGKIALRHDTRIQTAP